MFTSSKLALKFLSDSANLGFGLEIGAGVGIIITALAVVMIVVPLVLLPEWRRRRAGKRV